jgi:hypothetical protein
MLISGPPVIATGIALGCRSCANRSMPPYALTLKRYIFKAAILVQRESSVYKFIPYANPWHECDDNSFKCIRLCSNFVKRYSASFL